MGIGMNELITLLASLTGLALIFLLIRAVVLWYLRVNERVELLKRIDSKLDRLRFMDEKLALLVNQALR